MNQNQPTTNGKELTQAENELIKIGNAEIECRAAESIVEAKKSDLADAKANFEATVEKLRSLASGFANDQGRPLIDDESKTETKIEVETKPTGEVDWQSIPIEKLLDVPEKIKGLGKAKRTALIEKYATAGALDEVVLLSIKEELPLANYLPKGFGKSIADELASRLKIAKTTEVNVSVEKTDEEHREQITAAYSEIQDSKSFDSVFDADTHQAGKAAFDDDKSIYDCPFDDQESVDDWLRGWSTAAIAFEEARVDGAMTLEDDEPQSVGAMLDDI